MTDPFQGEKLRVVSRNRLSDQTAAALREYIVANQLAPGTRLPAEPSLAASLGVSRNVLRQAVASLEALGMLRVTQGSGTYVADLADTDVFQQIATWIGSATLSEEDYLEVRSIWERGIYELVLDRAKATDLAILEELARAIVDEGDPHEAGIRHQEFHNSLLRVTGNEFLVTVGTILHRFFWEFGYRYAIVRKPSGGRALDSHLTIVELLRSRDPGNIERMIDVHLSPHLNVETDNVAES
jgi:GntR family transcriptional regulator, transcriptional repressor for pyruvate dehydrogenase complex